MTDKSDTNEEKLDALLRTAATENDLPVGLMARVVADAERVSQDRRIQAVRPTSSGGFWQRTIASIFATAAPVGGVMVAGVAGFWLGIAPPLGFPDAGGVLFDTEVVTAWETDGALSGFGWEIEER